MSKNLIATRNRILLFSLSKITKNRSRFLHVKMPDWAFVRQVDGKEETLIIKMAAEKRVPILMTIS